MQYRKFHAIFSDSSLAFSLLYLYIIDFIFKKFSIPFRSLNKYFEEEAKKMLATKLHFCNVDLHFNQIKTIAFGFSAERIYWFGVNKDRRYAFKCFQWE